MGNDTGKTYGELEEMIRSQKVGPGSDGLIALPYFMGERTPIWDEKACGVLFGLTCPTQRPISTGPLWRQSPTPSAISWNP